MYFLSRIGATAAALAITILAAASFFPLQAASSEAPAPGLLAGAPVIQPQKDGTLYLNPEAAIQLGIGRDTRGIHDLKITNGEFTDWNGTAEVPYWVISVPASGVYRVILNYALPAGLEGTMEVMLWKNGASESWANGVLPSTGGWDTHRSWVLGTVKLSAGEQVVQFHPLKWMDIRHPIRLADVRLISVEPAEEGRLSSIFHGLGLDSLPEILSLKKTDAEWTAARKKLIGLKPDKFTEYSQFLDQDRAAETVVELNSSQRQKDGWILDAQLRLLAEHADQLNAGDRSFAEAWKAKIQGPYPKVVARQPSLGTTLYATGHLDDLPPQIENSPKAGAPKQVQLDLPAWPDAEARRSEFQKRNSDANLAALCRELHAVIKPGVAGLETFESAYQAGHYAAALDAYRSFFFDKLMHPEAHGASNRNFIYEWFVANGKGRFLRRPDPDLLAKNMQGIAGCNGSDNTQLEVHVGEPGSVVWAPRELGLPAGATYGYYRSNSPFWKTGEGRAKVQAIDFYRRLNVLPSPDSGSAMFPALLFSYTVKGDKNALERYCAYLDDWSLNSRSQMADCPVDIRAATETEAGQVMVFLNLLRIVADERPELAQDFPSATLARFLSVAVTDFVPYTVRARRAEQANWGIFGIMGTMDLARLLNEFKVMDYFNREGWRLAQSDFIQHLTLDGESFESWDTGHAHVDMILPQEAYAKGVLPADHGDDLERHRFMDNVRVSERNGLSHISPEGDYWTGWRPNAHSDSDLQARLFRNGWLEDIWNEPDATFRMQSILHGSNNVAGEDGGSHPTSQINPYAGMYYLRDGWGAGSDFLWMQNFSLRSQDQGTWWTAERLASFNRTCYGVEKDGRVLLDATAVIVDGNPPNIYYGQVPTGGKTSICGQSGRHVVETRFHTSERFDLAEAKQDSAYTSIDYNMRSGANDWYGLADVSGTIKGIGMPSIGKRAQLIRDVTACRQIFHLRGEGVYIVSDRLENSGPEKREYSQLFTLPRVLPEANLPDRLRVLAAAGAQAAEINPTAKLIRTTMPGADNISIRFAGHDLAFGGRLKADGHFDAIPSTGFEPSTASESRPSLGLQPVSVRWSGEGNQASVAVVNIRAAGETAPGDDLKDFAENNGPDGVAGCQAGTPGGEKFWYQTGPELVNTLQAGPASAEAESLLACVKSDAISGIVLGSRTLVLNGKTYTGSGDSFEYELDTKGAFTSIPIHTPIDTVQILPQASAFIDKVQVSFSLPAKDAADIEFHYTLDGKDPTLDSPLYAGSLTLTESTLVKVRPFRKGLDHTPWNTPGTDAGRTVDALFRREDPLPAQSAPGQLPGLDYQYFEGDWTRLFSYAGYDGILSPKSSGVAASLLDADQLAQVRTTDRSYAVRYEGYLDVPKTSVYQFFAPKDFLTTTLDAGYDLRVFVDDAEWFPNPSLHGENIWSIALQQGLHRFRVAYVDYRWKQFRDEYWMSWQEQEMGKVVPVLEIATDGMERQPIPNAWLMRNASTTMK